MKSFIFILISISLFAGCKSFYTNDITVTATYNYHGDSCKAYCHQIKLYIKNNTNEKIYIKGYKRIINNRLYTWLKRSKFRKYSQAYMRAYGVGSNRDSIKCTCAYSEWRDKKQPPPGFIKEAEKRELEIYRSINEFACHDSLIIDDNKSWVDFKYNESIIFLLPNEECFFCCSYLDYFISLNKKYRIYYLIGKRNRGENNYLKLNERMKNRKTKIWLGYLKEIAGYKFFEGKAKSNTLVIKNGKVIKNKPVPK